MRGAPGAEVALPGSEHGVMEGGRRARQEGAPQWLCRSRGVRLPTPGPAAPCHRPARGVFPPPLRLWVPPLPLPPPPHHPLHCPMTVLFAASWSRRGRGVQGEEGSGEGGVRLCTEFTELELLLGSDERKNRTHPGFLWPPGSRHNVEHPQETERPFFSSPSLRW